MGIKVMKEINGKLNTNKNKIYHFIKERKLVFRSFFVILICYILFIICSIYDTKQHVLYILHRKYKYIIIC